MLERLEDTAGAFHVALIGDPDLRTGFHDRQLANAPLRIRVEHMRFDPSLLEQVSDQMSFGQLAAEKSFFKFARGRVRLVSYRALRRSLV